MAFHESLLWGAIKAHRRPDSRYSRGSQRWFRQQRTYGRSAGDRREDVWSSVTPADTVDRGKSVTFAVEWV